MDAHDWWSLAVILTVMAATVVGIVSTRCATRLVRVVVSELRLTRQAGERYSRKVDECCREIGDASKLRREMLDSLRPPTNKSA